MAMRWRRSTAQAVTNRAWGVSLRWLGSNHLSVEYLRAENAKLLMETVAIEGRDVTIALRGGVTDSEAPAGGMLYNLKPHRN